MSRARGSVAHRERSRFFDEGKRLAAAGDPAADCWICHDPIDYEAAPNTTADSHNLDHYHPVSTHPDRQHDPTNWRHAHAKCNQTRGNRAPSPGLGAPMPNWW